jgi:hypothetical protein
MNVEQKDQAYTRMARESRRNGLLIGFLVGLGFALGIWGYDAIAVAGASGELPWLKFAIGLPFCLAICGLTGWLVARFDSGPIGALAWALTTIVIVWVASHLPFNVWSVLIGLIDRNFLGLNAYPFVESAHGRMILLYIVAGLLAAIAGASELFLIESATRASFSLQRGFTLALGMIIFIPIGLVVDNLINQPLREPIIGTNALIKFARYAETHTVSQETARSMGLRDMAPFGDSINQPYKLSLGYYDPQSLTESTVFIDFNGVRGLCFVLLDRPTFCQLSAARYANRLACLIKGNNPEKCVMNIADGAQAQLDSVKGQVSAETPEIGILGQRGTVVVLAVAADQGTELECILRDTGNVTFESCMPLQGQAFAAVQYTPIRLNPLPTAQESASTPGLATVAPLSVSTQLPGVPTMEPPSAPGTPLLLPTPGQPSQAMLPADQSDVARLVNAPRYTIRLNLDFDTLSFQGRSSLLYINSEGTAQGELYLRLFPNGKKSYGDGSLYVSQVTVDGQPVTTGLSQENTVLKVTLPTTVLPGQRIQMDMSFNGAVPVDFGGDKTPAAYGIYNLSQNVMALSGWYPILAVYDDQGWHLNPISEIGDTVFADDSFYTVEVCAASNLVIAATGIQTDRQASGSQTCTTYESGPAREFYLTLSPDFQVTSQGVDGSLVNSYFLPGFEGAGKQALQVGAGSLKIYNEKFGHYPYTELDIVQSPMRNALGVEFPGIVTVASSLYDTPDAPEFAVTTAHEVAHQWWYNVVGNDVFKDPWLDEALATYSSSLYYEYDMGPGYLDGLIQYWQQRYDNVRQEGNDDLITASLGHFETENPDAYGGVVYNKGALFFQKLRAQIGDQAFFTALQKYFIADKYSIATPDDLLKAFEDASGQDLDALYQFWLYSK